MTMELLRVPQSRKPAAATARVMARRETGRGEIRHFPTAAMRDTARRDLPVHDATTVADAGRAIAPSAPPVSMRVVGGLLCFGDAAMALLTGIITLQLVGPDLPKPADYYILVSMLGALVFVNTLYVAGVYRSAVLRRSSLPIMPVALSWCLATGVTVAAMAVSGVSLMANTTWLLLWLTIGLFMPLVSRAILAARVDGWRHAGRLQRRIAVFGTGPIGQRLLRKLSALTEHDDSRVVGVYDERLSRLPDHCMGHRIEGDVDRLLDDARKGRIDGVIVALPLAADRRVTAVVDRLRNAAIDIGVCLDQYGFQASGPGAAMGEDDRLAGVPVFWVERRPLRDWRGIAKEVEDRLFAAFVLVLIAPVLAAIALLIKLDSPGPVLFKQKRHGYNNRLIEVFKFRTMYHHAQDQKAERLASRDDPRVTRIGRILRRTSLDELPQFFNVLRGDMSVVGPRPHALSAKAGGLLYQEAVENYDQRHRMKPGITGWAQVSGWRGETAVVEQIEQRVRHDLYYIDNWSVLMDARIILRTVTGGFTGENAY